MIRHKSNGHYIAVYAVLFIVLFGAYIGLVRALRANLSDAWPPLWLTLIGLVLLTLLPALLIGAKFVQNERRSFVGREGLWLAFWLAFTSGGIVVLAIFVSEFTISRERLFDRIARDAIWVRANFLVWFGFAFVATLPMRLTLWLGMQRALRRFEITVADTFR